MASTYVNDLRLNEMATGDASGTWGTNTNVNLELIGEALGYGTEGITTNADTHTSTIADGATDPVAATGSVGTILVWSRIDESQSPNYNTPDGIDVTQTPNWEEVA